MTFRTSFLDWAYEQFPGLAAELEGDSARSRVHFAFAAFLEHTQAAIDMGDHERVVELFDMATRVLECAYPEMRSLFHVVFVEHLKFFGARKADRSWAIKLLTPALRDEFRRSIGGLPTAD